MGVSTAFFSEKEKKRNRQASIPAFLKLVKKPILKRAPLHPLRKIGSNNHNGGFCSLNFGKFSKNSLKVFIFLI